MNDPGSAANAPAPHDDVLNDIFGMFRDRGDSLYVGEPITQTEHALQAARLAETEGADSALIVAAQLHDVGHLLSKRPEDCANSGIDDRHEHLGAKWLRASWREVAERALRPGRRRADSAARAGQTILVRRQSGLSARLVERVNSEFETARRPIHGGRSTGVRGVAARTTGAPAAGMGRRG